MKKYDDMTIEEMLVDLEENAETVGFADYYERVLKHLSDEQVREHYIETFGITETDRYGFYQRDYCSE